MKITRSIRKNFRIRNKLKKVAKPGRFRLCITRSSKNISAQIIDDKVGKTLASASTKEKNMDIDNKDRKSLAEIIGKNIAKRSIEKGIKEVAFDKGKYKYHGLIKILADSARTEGLIF